MPEIKEIKNDVNPGDTSGLNASEGVNGGKTSDPNPVEDNTVDNKVVEAAAVNDQHIEEHEEAQDEGTSAETANVPSIRKFDKGRANRYVATHDNARSNRYDSVASGRELDQTDYDDPKVAKSAKERAYDNIEAEYSHDGTKNIDNSYQSKDSSINAEYEPVVQKSFISTETEIGKTSCYGDEMARSREVGRIFFDRGLVPFLTTHTEVVATAAAGSLAKEVLIKAGNQRFILFNEIDENVKVTGCYVMVQLGLFLLKGINPLPAMNFTNQTVNKVRIGFVERTSDSGQVRVPVYMYANHLFNVLELTSTVDDIKSATLELINDTTNIANRDYQIKIKNIASKMSTMVKASTEIKDAITESADFVYDSDRSTLFSVSRNDFKTSVTVGNAIEDGVDCSCYNDYESLIYAFDKFQSSEVMIVSILDNVDTRNIEDAMVFWKGQQGKSKHSKFFDSYLGMNYDRQDDYHNFPSLLSYARINQDMWNREAKWMGRYKTFFKNLREDLQVLKDSKLTTEYLTKVNVVQDSISDLLSAFEYGRISTDVKSSADLIKRTEEAKIILGFNPNNFIGFDTDSIHYDSVRHKARKAVFIANPGEIKMRIGKDNVTNVDPLYIPAFHAVCGYAVVAKNDIDTPDSKVYYVIPKWIQSLIRAMKDREFMKDQLFHQTSSGTINSRAAGLYFITMDGDGHITRQSGKEYLPYTWGHQKVDWLDYFLLKCMIASTNKKIWDEVYDSRNGMDRWRYFMENVEGFVGLYDKDERISCWDLYKKITENKALYYDANKGDTDSFDMLKNKSWMKDPFRKPIATLTKVKTTASVDGDDWKNIILFAADKHERNVMDLKGFTPYNFVGLDSDDVDENNVLKHPFKNINDVLYLVNNGTYKLAQVGENTFVLADANDKIVILKRCTDKDAGMRLELTTEGADDSILGYSGKDELANLFTEDNHFYTSLYDGYVITFNRHPNMRNESWITRSGDSTENDVVSREASKWLQYTAEINGILKFTYMSNTRKDRIEDGTRVEASFYHEAPAIILKPYKGPRDIYEGEDYNKLYQSSSMNDDNEVAAIPRNFLNADDLTEFGGRTDTVASPDPEHEGETLSTVIYTFDPASVKVFESDYVSKAAIPSFITGKITLFPRLCATYLDDEAKYHNGFGWGSDCFANALYNSASSNTADTTEPSSYRIVTNNSNKGNILKIQDGMCLGFPFRIEAFVPVDILTGENTEMSYTYKKNYATKADFMAQFGIDQVDANDRSFFDRLYYFSNDLNRIFKTNKDDYARFRDILLFCKMPASPEIAAHDDKLSFDLTTAIKERKDNNGKKVYEVKKLTLPYGSSLYDLSDIKLFEAFKFKHGLTSRLGFFPEPILLSGRVNAFGIDKTLNVCYYTDNKYEAMDIYGTNYINDIFDVRIGHCIIKPNEQWYESRPKAREFYEYWNKNSD